MTRSFTTVDFFLGSTSVVLVLLVVFFFAMWVRNRPPHWTGVMASAWVCNILYLMANYTLDYPDEVTWLWSAPTHWLLAACLLIVLLPVRCTIALPSAAGMTAAMVALGYALNALAPDAPKPMRMLLLTLPSAVFSGTVVFLLGTTLFRQRDSILLKLVLRRADCLDDDVYFMAKRAAAGRWSAAGTLFASGFILYGILQLAFPFLWFPELKAVENSLFLYWVGLLSKCLVLGGAYSVAYQGAAISGAVIDWLERGRAWRVAELEQRDAAEREQRRQREAEQAEQQRIRYLAFIAASIEHDARTPLSIIRARLRSLDREGGSPVARSAIGDLWKQVRRIEAVVDLVPLVRESADFYKRHTAKIRLDQLVRRTVREEQRAGRLGETTVSVQAGRVWGVGYSDRLSQAIANVLRNAADATQRGTLPGSPIEVEVVRSGVFAEVRIHDRGPGIGPEIGESVFAPGYSTKSGVENANTGVGLFIASRIVELHGGVISFTNREGGGVTFTIQIQALDHILSPDPESDETSPRQ